MENINEYVYLGLVINTTVSLMKNTSSIVQLRWSGIGRGKNLYCGTFKK